MSELLTTGAESGADAQPTRRVSDPKGLLKSELRSRMSY